MRVYKLIIYYFYAFVKEKYMKFIAMGRDEAVKSNIKRQRSVFAVLYLQLNGNFITFKNKGYTELAGLVISSRNA